MPNENPTDPATQEPNRANSARPAIRPPWMGAHYEFLPTYAAIAAFTLIALLSEPTLGEGYRWVVFLAGVVLLRSWPTCRSGWTAPYPYPG